MKLLSKIKQNYPIFLLILFELILFWLNYKPGTYFLGWDNLFPEANFSENIRRSFFATWQEYRGLGLLDGMSYAANLPHYVFLYLLSIFIPQNLLRWVFIFLMHLLGGIGIYKLISKLNLASQGETLQARKIIPLLGALFYQYNLATIQIFFAPYELFIVHFAFLPWLVLSLINYLDKKDKKSLFLFGLTSFLAIPQAHVPTIFIVYLGILFTFLLFRLLEKGKRDLKYILIAIILTFIINAFWLLPYSYSALHNAQTIASSKINLMSTEDIYLRNKAFGDFISTTHLLGFSIDFVDLKNNSENGYMMEAWRTHLSKPAFSYIAIAFFLLTVISIINALKNKDKKLYPLIALFLFSFLMLGNDIPVLGSVYNFFSKYIPYFFQLFRFTFTKFAIVYAFTFSILLSFGLSIIIKQLRRQKYSDLFVCLVFSGALFWYCLPAFQGNFIYSQLKVNIPQEYFSLIDFFKQQDQSERIVILPQPSFWGWTYNNWGYRGSGFIWYGLGQATLDGAFLPWSESNENFYSEMSYAVYSQNLKLIENILSKYQIQWLVLDQSIISPTSNKSLYMERLKDLLMQSLLFENIASFGKIEVYKFNLNQNVDNYVFLAQNLSVVAPSYSWNNFDQAYLENGNYVSFPSSTIHDPQSIIRDPSSIIYYPFRSLFTGRKQEELEFKVSETENEFIFKTKIPKELVGAQLIISPPQIEEITETDPTDPSIINYQYPSIFLDGEQIVFDPTIANAQTEINLSYIKEGNLEVRVPKIAGLYSYDSLLTNDLFTKPVVNCNQFDKGILTHDTVTESNENLLRLTSISANNCLNFELGDFLQRFSYLVTVKSRNVEGKSLLFAVINKNSERADLETYLPKYTSDGGRQAQSARHDSSEVEGTETSYFVIPPMQEDGLGYSLHFDNNSIGRVKTVNDLGQITVNPIPYHFLTSLKIIKNQEVRIKNQESEIEVSHPNPSYYELRIKYQEVSIKNETENNNYIVLSQSFDNGWKAYQIFNFQFSIFNFLNRWFPFIFGKELKDHVLVNNWQNAWILPSSTTHDQQSMIHDPSSTIILFYLPQLLEYLGFGVLVVGLIWLTLAADRRPVRLQRTSLEPEASK